MFFKLLLAGVVIYGLVYALFRRRFSLVGKHVLVTGGSEGIGLCVAREALRRGASQVTIVGRNEGKLKRAVEDLRCTARLFAEPLPVGKNKKVKTSSGVRVTGSARLDDFSVKGYSCDVSDGPAVERLFSELNDGPLGVHVTPVATAGLEQVPRPVDLLVCCAGGCWCDKLNNLSIGEIDKQIRVNVLGTMYPCREMMRFSSSERRAIVLLSSVAGQLSMFGFTAYGASKFAISGLWQGLSMEGACKNIDVICAFPPNTDTPGFVEENRRKPAETRIIEDTGGLWRADVVAARILHAVETNRKRVTFGLPGYLIGALTSGFSPSSSLFEVIADAVLMGPLRIIGAFLLKYWGWRISKLQQYRLD